MGDDRLFKDKKGVFQTSNLNISNAAAVKDLNGRRGKVLLSALTLLADG